MNDSDAKAALSEEQKAELLAQLAHAALEDDEEYPSEDPGWEPPAMDVPDASVPPGAAALLNTGKPSPAPTTLSDEEVAAMSAEEAFRAHVQRVVEGVLGSPEQLAFLELLQSVEMPILLSGVTEGHSLLNAPGYAGIRLLRIEDGAEYEVQIDPEELAGVYQWLESEREEEGQDQQLS